MLTDAFVYSIVTGIAVGIAAGYLGSLMVLKRMALVGDAMSHVALPGLALGVQFHFDPFIGAFAFLFVSALVIWHVGRTTKLPLESIVGTMFTFALALGIILYGETDLLEALFGNITTVTLLGMVAAIGVSAAAVFLTRMIYRSLVIGMISEDLAISKGVNVAVTNLIYLLLVSLVVAAGIKIVGTLLAGFLVIVPAVAAKNVSQNLARYALLSGIFGLISASIGIVFAGYQNILPGPLVVFVGIAIFAVTVVIRWRTK